MKKIMFNDAYSLTEAVLSGSKTMTRRIFVPKYNGIITISNKEIRIDEYYKLSPNHGTFRCYWPKYKKDETIAVAQNYHTIYISKCLKDGDVIPVYDDSPAGFYNKMFVKADLMPNKLKITGVKVERLQDISDSDCIKEGIIKHISHAKVYYSYNGIGNLFFDTPRTAFASLIDNICGKGTWKSNPYVFVYEFELLNRQA